MAATMTSPKTPTSSSNKNNCGRSFGLFPYLSEDLKLTVLNFVADAPLEQLLRGADDDDDGVRPHYTHSSLTHTLPLVSRKFREFSQADLHWKPALVRQLDREPYLWRSGLLKLGGLSEGDACVRNAASTEQLLELVQRRLYGDNRPLSYRALYSQVLSCHVRYKGNVFFMPGTLQIGEPYALHFFEPRYRFLIAELMVTQSESARRGGRVAGDVHFIHANRAPLGASTPAVLVQLQRCECYPDGRADVVLLPVAHVWLEKLWVRERTGHLYAAQCLKMPQRVTRDMNQLARQEALAQVMDALAGHVSAQEDEMEGGEEETDDEDDEESNDGDSIGTQESGTSAEA